MSSVTTGKKFDRLQMPPVRLETGRDAMAQSLCDVAKLFAHRGWAMGGSGHFSVTLRRDPARLLITGDGVDKSTIDPDDCLVVEAEQTGNLWPEADLHQLVVRHTQAGAVLHSQSPAALAISDAFASGGGLMLEGYDLIRQLNSDAHDRSRHWLAIIDHNPQSPCPARQLIALLTDPRQPARLGFLMRGCGLVSWGSDLAEARRYGELFETLLTTIVSRMILTPR